MEALHHELLIVQIVNWLLGPLVAAALAPLGFEWAPGEQVIPDYLVIAGLIVAAVTIGCLLIRSRLSVEDPGKVQILLEDGVGAVQSLLEEWIGPKGRRYLPLVGSIGVFVLASNYAGLIPGLMAPTSSINVTLGCALTVWVFYHLQGVREQGLWNYAKHFAVPPGSSALLAPIMLPIEIISHISRVLSLSLRLFGNIFGEELVIAILFSIIPLFVPLPMMFLGLITGGLQAFIFVLLTVIYLQGAVAVEHHDEAHGDEHGHVEAAPAHA
jgi:F-type H+-transporting ATPase subunit a